MAINVHDAEMMAMRRDQGERGEARPIEAAIDAAIREYYTGGAFKVDILSLMKGVRNKAAVQRELKRVYTEAGWSVAFEEGSTQRDEEWCYIRLIGRRAEPDSGYSSEIPER